MNADLSKVDLPVVQIDGLHASDDLALVAAIVIDTEDGKHPPLLSTRDTNPKQHQRRIVRHRDCR